MSPLPSLSITSSSFEYSSVHRLYAELMRDCISSLCAVPMDANYAKPIRYNDNKDRILLYYVYLCTSASHLPPVFRPLPHRHYPRPQLRSSSPADLPEAPVARELADGTLRTCTLLLTEYRGNPFSNCSIMLRNCWACLLTIRLLPCATIIRRIMDSTTRLTGTLVA